MDTQKAEELGEERDRGNRVELGEAGKGREQLADVTVNGEPG